MAKGRASSDGVVGWITLKSDSTKPWSPFYKCKKATPLHETASMEGSTVLREIEVGEVAELLEGPKFEDKIVWMKARMKKDCSVGWVTIKDSDGKDLFTC